MPNIENEVRRQARESVSTWRQEWVLPNSSGIAKAGSGSMNGVGVRILKWVKVQDNAVNFAEEDDVRAEDRVQEDSAILEAPVQSIHNAPVEHVPTNKLSMSGGLGTIAPREPPATTAVSSSSAALPSTTQTQSQGDVPGNAAPLPTNVLAEPLSVATASAILLNDSNMSGTSTPGVDTSQNVFVTDGASGTQTPQIQPQVEAQLNNTTSSATDLPEGVSDPATLAVLATAGDSAVAQDAITETIDPNQPGQPVLSIETGPQTGAPPEIPPTQQEETMVQPASQQSPSTVDVEMTQR